MNIAEEMAYRAIGSGDREMKKKTILFFQGLFENSIAQDTILSFCKDTQRIEIQKKIQFLRKRILLSDRAEEINTKLKMLESQIEEQKMPIDFWRIQENINILTGSIQLYTLRSMQLLEQEFFMPDNIDLISPIFEKYALSKGIPSKDTIIEDKSVNTLQNMKFSKVIMDNLMPNGYKSIFVTNNYHVFSI